MYTVSRETIEVKFVIFTLYITMKCEHAVYPTIKQAGTVTGTSADKRQSF